MVSPVIKKTPPTLPPAIQPGCPQPPDRLVLVRYVVSLVLFLLHLVWLRPNWRESDAAIVN